MDEISKVLDEVFNGDTQEPEREKVTTDELRAAYCKAAKEKGNQEAENKFCKVVENADIMRLQLFFDGKPEDKVRDILKGNGFKWSPKNGCWQRQLTANAKYALSRVIKELEKLEETA